jgi:hypothetical protein
MSSRWPLAAAIVILLPAALAGRMILGAQRELQLAEQAQRLSAGHERQVRHLQRAMAYYFPGSPWVAEAHDRLLALARTLEREQQNGAALEAYRQLRGAILSLRSTFTPYESSLPEIGQRIAALSARDPHAAKVLQGAAGQRLFAARLATVPEPHRGLVALGLGGFAIWIGGGVILFWRGVRPDGSWIGRRAWLPLFLALLGFAAFLLGMGLA